MINARDKRTCWYAAHQMESLHARRRRRLNIYAPTVLLLPLTPPTERVSFIAAPLRRLLGNEGRRGRALDTRRERFSHANNDNGRATYLSV